MRSVSFFSRTAVLAALILSAALSAISVAHAQVPVRVVLFNFAAHWSDLYIAADQGFFDEAGLKVSMTAAPRVTANQALLSNEADLVGSTIPTTFLANVKGGDLRVVYQPTPLIHEFFGRQGIASMQDIRGKTFGCFQLTDGDMRYLLRYMEGNGIARDDVNVVVAGPSPQRLSALLAGSIDVTALNSPSNFEARKAGLTLLWSSAELDEPEPLTYVVRASWAEKNRDALVQMLRALNRAHEFGLDPANREQVIATIEKWTKHSPEISAQAYSLFWGEKGVFTRDGLVTRSQYDEAVLSAKRLGAMEGEPPSWENSVDLSFVQAAQQK